MRPMPFFDHDGQIMCNGDNNVTLEIYGIGDFARLYRDEDCKTIQMELYSHALSEPMQITDTMGDNVTKNALSEMIFYGLKILGYDEEGEDFEVHNMYAPRQDMKLFRQAATEAAYNVEQENIEPFLFDVEPSL
jgi:hypothetical protein